MSQPHDFPLEPSWRALLADLGVRPADVLRRAGLPDDLVSRPSVRLGTSEYFRFWTSLEAEVGDPLFPIRLAEVVTTESFTPPLFAALCSPSLAVAARRIQRYKRLIAPMTLHVDERPEALDLRFEWLDATVAPPASLVAAELAFMVRLARLATREDIRPLAVASPTPLEPAAAYERFFGVAPRSGDAMALSFSGGDARLPFLTANETIWQTFEPELRKRLAELDESATTADRVRAALLELLPAGQASMEAVSSKLATSKRTLQRRLRQEETTFQQVLSLTREALARHYLGTTSMSGAEISFLLGFEDPNSFFRAFSDWTGSTPEKVRSQLRG